MTAATVATVGVVGESAGESECDEGRDEWSGDLLRWRLWGEAESAEGTGEGARWTSGLRMAVVAVGDGATDVGPDGEEGEEGGTGDEQNAAVRIWM